MAPGFRIERVLPTLSDKAVQFLRRKHTQPYFLYLALPAPHTPWLPLEKYKGKSKAGIYGDFVAMVDDTLGQVLKAIDRRNTLVVFTSDNGADWKTEDKARFAHRANANWRGEKADIWDAGHRIPFLARWPGRIPAGTVSSELGCLTDFMATAAGIVGAELPRNAGEDSYDLLPAMLGRKGAPIREAIVHHSNLGMFAIRQGKWKLELGLGSGGFTPPARIEPTPGGPTGQLYNLENDPAEEVNLYQQQPEIVAQLTALLEHYQQQGHSRL
jgi:arylsulfatase A-like enzyme